MQELTACSGIVRWVPAVLRSPHVAINASSPVSLEPGRLLRYSSVVRMLP